MLQKNFSLWVQVRYLGFRYHGWQIQPEVKTVQGMLKRTFRYVLGDKYFKMIPASRTDAMVSVWQSVFQLQLREECDIEALMVEVNKNLPADISLLSISEADPERNIIQDLGDKEYQYYFTWGKKMNPYCAPFMAYFPGDLDLELMNEVCPLFEGTHDFRIFSYQISKNSETIKSLSTCEIIQEGIISASFFPDNYRILRVRGSGFLRYQIRLMMGALIQVGRKEISVDDLRAMIQGDKVIDYVAPASGLHKIGLEGID